MNASAHWFAALDAANDAAYAVQKGATPKAMT
jgi:hypothetical protein